MTGANNQRAQSKPRPTRRTACDICRYRRIKCDGNFGRDKDRATCSNCASRGFECTYTSFQNQQQDNQKLVSSASSSASLDQSRPNTPPSSNSISPQDFSDFESTRQGPTSSRPDIEHLSAVGNLADHALELNQFSHSHPAKKQRTSKKSNDHFPAYAQHIYGVNIDTSSAPQSQPPTPPSSLTAVLGDLEFASINNNASTLLFNSSQCTSAQSVNVPALETAGIHRRRFLDVDPQETSHQIPPNGSDGSVKNRKELLNTPMFSPAAKHDFVQCALVALKLRGVFDQFIDSVTETEYEHDSLISAVLQTIGIAWSVHSEAIGRKATTNELTTRLAEDAIQHRAKLQLQLLAATSERVRQVIEKDVLPDMNTCFSVVIFCTFQMVDDKATKFPSGHVHDWMVQKLFYTSKGLDIWGRPFRQSLLSAQSLWRWYSIDSVLALNSLKMPCFRPQEVYSFEDCELSWMSNSLVGANLSNTNYAMRDIHLISFQIYNTFLTPIAKSKLVDEPVPIAQTEQILIQLEMFRQFHSYLFDFSFSWTIAQQTQCQESLFSYFMLWQNLWNLTRHTEESRFRGESDLLSHSSNDMPMALILSRIKVGLQNACIEAATFIARVIGCGNCSGLGIDVYAPPSTIRSSIHVDRGLVAQFCNVVLTDSADYAIDSTIDPEWPTDRIFSVLLNALYEGGESRWHVHELHLKCNEKTQLLISQEESLRNDIPSTFALSFEMDDCWQIPVGDSR